MGSTIDTNGMKQLSFNVSSYNNITYYEIIYTSTNPVTNQTDKTYSVMFGKNDQIMYHMLFKTPEADFEAYHPIFKQIQESIKYN